MTEIIVKSLLNKLIIYNKLKNIQIINDDKNFQSLNFNKKLAAILNFGKFKISFRKDLNAVVTALKY